MERKYGKMLRLSQDLLIGMAWKKKKLRGKNTRKGKELVIGSL